MPAHLNAGEVFDVAIQIERIGAAFYRKAAKLTPDETLRKDLTELAEMEDGHEVMFSRIKDELIGQQADAEWYDPEGEAAQYLQAFAQGKVFNLTDDATEDLTESTTTRDILTFALGRERDAIVFFVGLKELMPDGADRSRIDAIIGQEMSHVTLLTGKLIALEAAQSHS